jgi:outer membrane protein OmpA-like peptidoglycan-associated protein
MDEALKVLRDNPEVRVVIEGHRDAQEQPYGRQLSRERAKAVHDHFVAEGIDPARLCIASFGPERPIALSATPKGRDANRRVEFRMLQDGEPCPQSNP